MPRKLSYLGRFLSPVNSLNVLNKINTSMDTNISTHNHNGSIKPVIFYNGRFHFVEEDTAAKFHFDTDYALFQIYNLKGTKHDIIEAITDVAGPAGSISFLNDFERTFSRCSDHRIELRAGSSIEINDPAKLKVKIKFSNKSHVDVVEGLRTSTSIAELTLNGFADWVPLDSTSYECIIQSSETSHDNSITKSESESRHTILRALSDNIDPVLLDVVIDDLLDDFESGAFRKLFPGPIVRVDRGINEVVMTVVLTRGRYPFDEDMGKIFIEILNALIQDRKIEKKFDKHIYDSFFLLVVRILNLIRDLVHLNETYEDFHSPGVCPLFANSIKFMKVKYIESLTDLEKALIDIGFDNFEDRLQELTMMIREVDRCVETAYGNLQADVEKWKKRRSMANFSYFLSILIAIALPSIYHYYRQTEYVPFGPITSILGCVLGFFCAFWHGWSRNSYDKAISSHRKAIPIHSSTTQSLDSLERWLNRISIVKRCKIPMNYNELKGRKAILSYLFDELVSSVAELRLSICLEDELRRYR
ncbi:16884_t:CDS:2 [Funneliformis geosporum]|uniref:2113_t:CDS:1 n=1 Tax=Funneliformis geosporum TaxID=1117311 RepID=A0A9W4WX80_9GLOM|nr:16884_t:CDS:2 [Funneliformis geosporum]CAI2170291.1 2113_t:CDS:2 [Funneliformis geosporum]